MASRRAARDAVPLIDDETLEYEIEQFYGWTLSRSGLFVNWHDYERGALSTGDIETRAKVAEDDVRESVDRMKSHLAALEARIDAIGARRQG